MESAEQHALCASSIINVASCSSRALRGTHHGKCYMDWLSFGEALASIWRWNVGLHAAEAENVLIMQHDSQHAQLLTSHWSDPCLILWTADQFDVSFGRMAVVLRSRSLCH